LSSIYEVPVDPDAENNCHSFALSFVGYNKSVLEVGCSTGYITKILVERGCDVVGMELDPDAAKVAEQWAERVVVGNIDDGEVWNDVKDESFDVVLLGDVLEHLRDPLESLRQAVRKLKPSGFVVTSLPNVAHGDVRMSLLQGLFRYRPVGLLDHTHVRFFTLETARELLIEAGLWPVETMRVVVPLFQSELGVRREDVSPETVDELLTDPEIETYQFVMKSVRDNGTRTLAELARRVNDLSDRVAHESVRTALLRNELFDYEQFHEQQRYIEALQGHASGLDHNIEVLNEALTSAESARAAVEARYQAVLGMKTVQMTAPIRWIYNKLSRAGKKTT
jgi:O-antigen biosynthesis protein